MVSRRRLGTLDRILLKSTSQTSKIQTSKIMTSKISPRTFERLAATLSGGIVLFMICYWISQIVGVVHMLRLAYG